MPVPGTSLTLTGRLAEEYGYGDHAECINNADTFNGLYILELNFSCFLMFLLSKISIMKKIFGSISRRRLASGTGLLISLFLISTGCTKSDNTYGDTTGTGTKGGPGANEVFIQGNAFSPSTITVDVNTTVKWTNKDGVVHTVTSDDGSFNSGSIPNNGTFSYTFTTAGTFNYHCAVHTGMTGIVKVNSVGGY